MALDRTIWGGFATANKSGFPDHRIGTISYHHSCWRGVCSPAPRIIRGIMKPEEHLLTISVFAKQLQMFRALFEMLRSAGLADPGDFDAFVELVRRHENASDALFDSAFEFYLEAARHAGVATGLDNYRETGRVSPG